MQSSLDLNLRDQLARYLTGDVSLDEFKDWLAAETWDLEQHGNPASTLAIRVKHRLAEQSSGYCTEEDLKHMLRPLAAVGAAPAVPAG